MYGGWDAWMPGGVSGLSGFGDAASVFYGFRPKVNMGRARGSPTRNPLLGGSVFPLRWSNQGCLHVWRPGCLGVSGLGGFGDAALKDLGDCSCNLARSSSGRGRRILQPERELRPGGHEIGKSAHAVHIQGPVWLKVFPMGAKVPASQPASLPASHVINGAV